MNISSTPFIRNDYWPDYNDINQLNQRIDEAENEISLVNIRLSADIENVSNNLNTYANEQANTTVANNVIVNNLNANYAEGRFANFDNTFTNNAYIENLTVNKPVFDITLNTPHLENTTSLGGNFYNANLFDAKLLGDISGDLNVVNVNQLNAVNAVIANLFVNTSATPIQSSAVLGYDSEGKVIPIHATFDVGFPEDADYLFTDHSGTARKGVKATEIGAVENLITAYGVKNAIDALNAEVLDNFNAVTGALNDIDAWQNSFENSVANTFRDVNNTFNDVNNFVNDSLNGVNNYVSNNFNNFNNNFDNIENDVSNLNNTTNNISNNLDSLLSALEPILGVANVSGWVSSSSPVNIQGITEFKVAPFAAASMIGSDVGNGAKLNVSGTVVTLGLPSFQWTKGNMDGLFSFCLNFNQNFVIPTGVASMVKTFLSHYGLGAPAFNQNLLIPNSVTNMSSTFSQCLNLKQSDMYIYSQNVTNLDDTFYGCHINKIHIPTSVPKSTLNYMYNCLVNGNTGITFSAANIFNDLPVDIEQWPPV